MMICIIALSIQASWLQDVFDLVHDRTEAICKMLCEALSQFWNCQSYSLRGYKFPSPSGRRAAQKG